MQYSDRRKCHHRSHKHDDNERQHRHKRSRRPETSDSDDEERLSRKRRRAREQEESATSEEDEGDGWVEKEELSAPMTEETLDKSLADARDANIQRDSWMEAPSAIDVDYVQKRQRDLPTPAHTAATQQDYKLKIHDAELNQHLRDIPRDDEPGLAAEPAEHEVNYEFGDSGSAWRMTKLKAVYRQAKESGRPLEDVASERYGDLRDFDDAREEEIELDRRKTYGKGYVGKIKPSGELFEERKLANGIHRPSRSELERPKFEDLPQGEVMREESAPLKTVPLDQTALNKLKAQMMKAKLRKDPKAADLEAEYNAAMAGAANNRQPDVVVLGAEHSRMLANRDAEVKKIENKRGRERGLVEENEDMSIEDMVRQERRTRGTGGGEGQEFANRIAKDAKFDNDLDYIDENASKLAKRVQTSEINLRNTAISDFHKMNRILDSCPLCHHEDSNQPPQAPVVSLATRTYLTLPTEPEISEGGAVIIPIQHRKNLLECDDDEWEEIRNFMKSLTRMYHDQGRDVVFYENAANPARMRHASLEVVPLPYSLGETAPAFFREAILSADEEWTQHKKLIDTLARSKDGLGKLAFRRSIAKEMPYFHVWFELDGGMGHIVEDTNRWPKGDLFARETLGGMLDIGPDVVKRQGRWSRSDRRVEPFRKRWRKFDWTRVLTDG